MSAKIALIMTITVVLAACFFSHRHYWYERETIFRNSETQLLHIGEGLRVPVESSLKKQDHQGIRKAIAEAAREADVILITAYNARGRVISCSSPQWSGRDLINMYPEAVTVEDIAAVQKALGGGYAAYYDGQHVRSCLVMPLVYGESGTGALFISLDLVSTMAQINKRAVEGILLALLVAALSGVAAYFLFHALFASRVKSISATATRLASGDISSRTEVGGIDEIGYLAASFNNLAEEITNWHGNLEEAAASRMNELLVLFDVVNTISQSLDMNAVLPKVLDQVVGNMGVVQGAVVLVGSDGLSLTLVAQRGLSDGSACRISGAGQGGIGDVILRNKAMRISAGDEDEPESVPGLEKDDIRSALIVPISARGAVLGALALYSPQRHKFTDENEALLATIGNQVSVAVLNARLYEKTLELAQEDGLTRLANRRHLMERLKQEVYRAERYHTSLSLIMLDLDKFKSFNDSYGHLKGDELLREFAIMVAHTIRVTDIAGRYGGEEFAIILPNTALKGAIVIAERIRLAMEGLRIDTGEGSPPAGRTISIGIAEFLPGDTEEKLVGSADAALYRAKQGGRNRVSW